MVFDSGYQTVARSLFYGIKGYNPAMSKIYKSILSFSISDEAKFRLEVIKHFDKFGFESTQGAYKVSRASVYRWRKELKESQCSLKNLIPKSRRPKRLRQMTTDVRLIDMIRDLRQLHYRIGKRKIKPISVDTIGKIIKRHNLFFQKNGRIYHNPNFKRCGCKLNYKTKVKRSPRVVNPGYLEIDTIHLFIDGIKIHIYHSVDIQNKFGFAYGYTSLNSQNTVNFLNKIKLVYPIESGIKTIQTDNGLEFLGDFG